MIIEDIKKTKVIKYYQNDYRLRKLKEIKLIKLQI
jgi:hypothetical protein